MFSGYNTISKNIQTHHVPMFGYCMLASNCTTIAVKKTKTNDTVSNFIYVHVLPLVLAFDLNLI